MIQTQEDMMEYDKVAVDEARRTVQHASVKSKVEGDVNAEIVGKAAHPTTSQTAKIDEAAGEFRRSAIDETVAAEREVGRARGAARGSQVIDYVFYVAYSLLAIRLRPPEGRDLICLRKLPTSV
jgi:hypothetical protein